MQQQGSSDNSESSSSSSSSSWKPAPISYHLDTIGIGEVYVSPPPLDLMYKPLYNETEETDNSKEQHGDQSSSSTSTTFISWETIGSIKSCPQDFVVREIGGGVYISNVEKSGESSPSSAVPSSGSCTNNFQQGNVANLTDTITLPPLPEATKAIPCENDDGGRCKKQRMIAGDNEESKVATTNNNIEQENEYIKKSEMKVMNPKGDQDNIKYVKSLKDVIECIVSECVDSYSSIRTADTISTQSDTYSQIQSLFNDAMNDLISISSKETRETNQKEAVIIPPMNDGKIILPQNNETTQTIKPNNVGEFYNRSIFHQVLKLVFPLLASSTLSNKEMKNMIGSDQKLKGVYIKVVKDTSFHALIPYLSHVEDLVSLYKFRNRGCIESKGPPMLQGGKRNKKMNRNKRDHDHNQHEAANESKDDEFSPPTEVYLRLKPEISKEKRRDIHHLISQTYRDLDTGTTNNVTINGEDINNVTAIVVYWSRRAQRKLTSHKRKRQHNVGMKKKNVTNTLCILKKTNQEHMAIIQHLASALKCSQSDIGFAGIKDMRAVTHQYCTLLNISPRRAQIANTILKEHDIQLGNFERVNWFLQTGMHQGNEFEIIVRDLNRILFRKDSRGCFEEKFIPCKPSHIDAMVQDIRRDGFVNFFGEQRVGNAGSAVVVGVRSFDIGRAMLKENFMEAIDLLMTGRFMFNGEYFEGEKQRDARRIWKETRDPDATLAAIPQGKAMTRERIVLRGLKRYGKQRPLEALQCLPFSVRMFWIHAYQSFVWNNMATQRMLLGSKPLVGDLYFETNGGTNIKVVTDPSTVSFSQIVLPLPGTKVQYPENCIGEKYKEFLAKDLGFDHIKRNSIQESSAKGSYRALVVIPKYFMWDQIKKNKDDDNSFVSDVELRFSLPSGSYATMLLRELMKSPLAR